MKTTKKWRNKYDIYDKYRLAEYSEAKAKEGWKLVTTKDSICSDSINQTKFRK